MDGGVFIFLDQPLTNQNSVLIVVAFPSHEANQHIAAKTDFAVLGGRTVRQEVADLNDLPLIHTRALVDASALVAAGKLSQMIAMLFALIILDNHFIGGHAVHNACMLGKQHHAGVVRGLVFHAGADDGGFGNEQRHGLTLHIAAHQGAVCVVVFKEGNHGGGNGHNLLG